MAAGLGVILASVAAGGTGSGLALLPALGELLTGVLPHLLPLGVLLLRQHRCHRGDEILLYRPALAHHAVGARRVVLEAIEDIVISRLQLKKEYSTRDFSVVVKDVDNRRLIRIPKGSAHPETLTMRHRDLLLDTPAHYARKFDADVDAGILDLLAGHLQRPR